MCFVRCSLLAKICHNIASVSTPAAAYLHNLASHRRTRFVAETNRQQRARTPSQQEPTYKRLADLLTRTHRTYLLRPASVHCMQQQDYTAASTVPVLHLNNRFPPWPATRILPMGTKQDGNNPKIKRIPSFRKQAPHGTQFFTQC